MAIIEAANVTRTYGKGSKGSSVFTAVAGVSLSVARGELVSVLGVNGAGKTSLVEVIEGIAPAASGTVRVLGRDPVRDRPLIRPRMGIMLQEAGFAQALTVAETLRMWAGTLTSPRPVTEALELVDLTRRADIRVKSLSGGERRRLDLAMAILGRPHILFLDEPTTGLDPASRRRTWDLIRRMLAEGTTVLLTTHYLEEAEELADRVLIMAAGLVRAQGTVAEIVSNHPSHLSFSLPAPSPIGEADLHALPALVDAPERARDRIRLFSSDLHMTLSALMHLADTRGVRLTGLNARSASLEQAFLALTAEDTDSTDDDGRRAPEAA